MRGRGVALIAVLGVLAGAAGLGGAGATAASTAASSAAAVASSSDLAALPGGAWGLKAYAGHVIFSTQDPGTAQWQLMEWHDGVISALAVPARSVPFDADVGPDANGDPAVVYSRCTTEPSYDGFGQFDWATARGCRIWELSLLGGSPQRVSALGAPGASDSTPAIWDGAIAFARVPAHASPRVPVIYLWTAGRPLRRLPGGSPPCPLGTSCPHSHAWAAAMSLDGNVLAIDWALKGYHVAPAGCGGLGGEIWEMLADQLSGGQRTFADTGGYDGCNATRYMPASPSAVGGSILYSWQFPVERNRGDAPLDESTRLVSFAPAARRWETASVAPGPAVANAVDSAVAGVAADGATTYWVSYSPSPAPGSDQYALANNYPIGVCDTSPLTDDENETGSCELEATTSLPLVPASHTAYFVPPTGLNLYSPTPAIRGCDTGTLRLELDVDVSPKTEQTPLLLRLVNRGSGACALNGYPLIKLDGPNGSTYPFTYRDSGDQEVTSRQPGTVTLLAGASAWVLINKNHCVTSDHGQLATRIELAPPESDTFLDAALPGNGPRFDYCAAPDPGNHVEISPVEPTALRTSSAPQS